MTTKEANIDQLLNIVPAYQEAEAAAYCTLQTLFESNFNGINLIADAKKLGYRLEDVLGVIDLFVRSSIYKQEVNGIEMLDDKRTKGLKKADLARLFIAGDMIDAMTKFVVMADQVLNNSQFESTLTRAKYGTGWKIHIKTWIRKQLLESISEYYQDHNNSDKTQVDNSTVVPELEAVKPAEPTDLLKELTRIPILKLASAELELEIALITNEIHSSLSPLYDIGEHTDLFIAQQVVLAFESAMVDIGVITHEGRKTPGDRGKEVTTSWLRPKLNTVNTSTHLSALEVKNLRKRIKEVVELKMPDFLKKLDDLSKITLPNVHKLGGKMAEMTLLQIQDRIARHVINSRDRHILEMVVDANKGLSKKK